MAFFLNKFLLFTLILITGLMISVNTESNTNTPITLQGTFYGGCGTAFMAKRKIVFEVKKFLEEAFGERKFEINVNMKNYQPPKFKQINTDSTPSDNPVEDVNSIYNKQEFNIFVIKDNKRYLVGTSDKNHPGDKYTPYMESSYRNDKDLFLQGISEKILNFVDNKFDS